MNNHSDDWEDFFAETRRELRRERRNASQKDRSQYKKTDQDKKQPPSYQAIPDNATDGRIVCIQSAEVIVNCNGKDYVCTLRGTFKQHKQIEKNLLVVGDTVKILPLSNSHGVIVQRMDRKSILSRQDHLDRVKQQIIAANVDTVCIVTSSCQPLFLYPLIDRYRIVARKGNMNALLIMNKMDLCADNPSLKASVNDCFALYQTLGLPCIGISVKTGENLEKLLSLLDNTISVFAGQSGTGKTALLNAIAKTEYPVGAIRAIGKGAHTTTCSILLPLPSRKGFIIDTPGIRSLGIFQLTHEDLVEEYPELFSLPCQFSNCTHVSEQGCALQKALDEGLVSPIRYKSYCSLLSSLQEERKRR